ncbi:hypothetical protein PIB30_060998 [Stylosanthes scabra]|uniref:Uncharacterized protein n=1 Tax=Stylosanthes scabra TaxID=79078 RepID=A0ABU6YLA3_9FABA|nr:hypothetical protein [Stylosanthes scabra]
MARKGKEIASASTPSRALSTKNSNRGRAKLFRLIDSTIKSIMIGGMLWSVGDMFMNGSSISPRKNLISSELVCWGLEFCANVSSTEQDVVFLRGVKIPFTEDAIHRHLGIRIDLPDLGVDDAFEAVVKVYKEGNLNMTDVSRVIGREDTNWADDPAVDTIPNPLDHAILNAHASAFNKVIVANVDPKTHGMTFDMSH